MGAIAGRAGRGGGLEPAIRTGAVQGLVLRRMTHALWITGSPTVAAGRYARGCRQPGEAAIRGRTRTETGRAEQTGAEKNWLKKTGPKVTKIEMAKTDATSGDSSPRAAARQARAERLAAALKANLRRRKAQARERAADTGQRETEPARDQIRAVDKGS